MRLLWKIEPTPATTPRSDMSTPEKLAREKINRWATAFGFITTQSTQLNGVRPVCVATIQRLYPTLRGEEIDPEIEERPGYEVRASLWKQSSPVVYNPNAPIETFDFISPINTTAPSIVSGGRSANTSTSTSSAPPPRLSNRRSASLIRTSWNTAAGAERKQVRGVTASDLTPRKCGHGASESISHPRSGPDQRTLAAIQ